jgi:ORF6N domain
MLDSDLAELYQVQTKNLNKAVKSNPDRFPEDFMFRVAPEEIESLRFQIGTSNTSRGGRRYLPYVFLNTGLVIATHKDLAHKIDDLEVKYQEHDHELKVVFDAIRKLISTPAPTKRRMGFAVGNS